MSYKHIKQLGAGHFGTVNLELDENLDRYCAVKYVPAPLTSEEHAEARAMLLAQHENVVEIYSADVVDEHVVIRMEYLPSGSVESKYEGAPVPTLQAMQIIEDACRGVQHLHNRALLHRDIKPANLLFGPNQRVKVSDFGLAGKVNDPATYPAMGYLKMLPPEAWSSPTWIDTAVGDIYSLGVTAYRLLNGDALTNAALPADGDLKQSIERGSFPDRKSWQPYIHSALKRAVVGAIAIDPAKRYSSASLFRNSLERARPFVSWQVAIGPHPDSWSGLSRTGQSWEAQISYEESEYSFSVRRGAGTRTPRESRKDRFCDTSYKRVFIHASKVLQRIASSGV